MTLQQPPAPTPSGTSRRTVLRTAAWTAPAITVAATVPAFAGSPGTDLGNFSLNGSCGVLGAISPGFTLTAGADEAIPAGTIISIVNTGVVSLTAVPIVNTSGTTNMPGLVNVDVLANGSFTVTLAQALPAGATLRIGWLLAVNVLAAKNASVTLPTGYTAGAGAKTSGGFSSTLILCSST